MAEMSFKPDWEGLQAAYESEDPDNEIIIIQHRVMKREENGDFSRQVHVMHKLGDIDPRKRIAEALINNAMRGQHDVDELINTLLYVLKFSKEEIDRLRGFHALNN